MNVRRRDFLKYVGTGTIASTLPADRLFSREGELSGEQKLHHDYQSNNEGTEYYVLGNGLIFAALQSSDKPEAGTHAGLLLMSAEHFGRKISTYLYHPERGLQNSRATVVIEGKGYVPEPGNSAVTWEYPHMVPTIVMNWKAGECSVREELVCPIDDPVLFRNVTVKNNTTRPLDPTLTVLLYPNLMYFDEYNVDRERGTLEARGYKSMQLFSLSEATAGDRHLSIRFGRIDPGKSGTVTVVLTLDLTRKEFENKGMDRMMEATRTYWSKPASVATGRDDLDHLVRVATSGIRAAVARSGKMDGSIWQYNLEWVRDQSMVAVGAAMSGQPEIAEALLKRILTRSVDESGKTVDASRHRPPETIELDQNGELLYALYMHWVWSGNDSIIREHWKKIKNVADYVLQPVFMEPEIGLVKNSREYWERDPAFGVKEGYENTYQLWNIVGLETASHMAARFDDRSSAQRWMKASRKMKESYLSHPRFSLVEKGVFIKRRLANGEVQRTFEPPNRKAMPPGMPLNVEPVSYCDPDAGNVLPIALGVVEGQSPLALKTLESIELLWNQRWDFGGYARYHVTSEPDSPGPWPFATLFIARAYLETGNHEKVWRALNWLLNVRGGKAGAWMECYGDRPTPPLPPLGIVVWTWAEMIMFFIHHMLGVRPTPTTLVIRPRLLAGLEQLKARIQVQGHSVLLDVRREQKEQWAVVNGTRMSLKNQTLEIPLPRRETSVEIHL